MLIQSEVKVAQSCPTLCDPMDYTVHGIHQARMLEWVAFPFSRGSSQPRDRTQVSHIAAGFFTIWAIREAQRVDKWYIFLNTYYLIKEFLCVKKMYLPKFCGVFVLFCFWWSCVAFRIPLPSPGCKPAPPAVEAQSLNHWTTRDVPNQSFKKCVKKKKKNSPYAITLKSFRKKCSFFSHAAWEFYT